MSTDHTSPLDPYGLPALDCHAHVAPDVTQSQLATLSGAHVFAVTRSLAEARTVQQRADTNLAWGIGVHPAVSTARTAYDPDQFRELLPRFALVGEVGLDKRAAIDDQRRILEDILQACRSEPVIISMHSTGMTLALIELIEKHRHPGTVLHWWLGTPPQTERAVAMDAFFSVNAAMSDDRLNALPRNRVLPETDYPAKQTQATKPGQIEALQKRLAALWKVEPAEVRRQWWINLREVTTRSGALERVSEDLADIILTA